MRFGGQCAAYANGYVGLKVKPRQEKKAWGIAFGLFISNDSPACIAVYGFVFHMGEVVPVGRPYFKYSNA